jgi:hypothetical protein
MGVQRVSKALSTRQLWDKRAEIEIMALIHFF